MTSRIQSEHRTELWHSGNRIGEWSDRNIQCLDLTLLKADGFRQKDENSLYSTVKPEKIKTKITPARILVIFLMVGAILGGFGIYNYLVQHLFYFHQKM